MTLTAEPLTLRLPKDVLVLQPMHGHLELEPTLLHPGQRCVIGSAEHCSVRLTKSPLVQPEHIVITVAGRQTMLSAWAADATWLNDRLVTEPHELLPGDRVAIGPFDFRLRSATPEEMLYAKLAVRDTDEGSNARDEEGSHLSHERLNRDISRLLEDLQNQVTSLQEREVELQEELRRQREDVQRSDAVEQSSANLVRAEETDSAKGTTSSPIIRAVEQSRRDIITQEVRSELAQLAQQIQRERDQLQQERAAFLSEQATWQDRLQQDAVRQAEWIRQAELLKAQQETLRQDQQDCHQLSEQLGRKAIELSNWESRLQHADAVQARERMRLEGSAVMPWKTASVESTSSQFGAVSSSSPVADVPEPRHQHIELVQRPLQTLLTLIAFLLSAVLLGFGLGDQESSEVLGWGTAIIGAISTVDLLVHRWVGAIR